MVKQSRPRPAHRVASKTVPIQDRERLARFVRLLVEQCGSLRKASREIGITPTQLSRLANRQLGEVSLENYQRLAKVVVDGERGRRLFKRAFVRQSPADLRRAYRGWLQDQRVIASQGATRRWYRTPHGIADEEREDFVAGKSDRDREREAFWQYVATQAPDMVRDAERMLRRVKDRGYRDLALSRMLDPLINASDTGFIEPSWREWRITAKGNQRLIRFVKHGLGREQLLLRGRPQSGERALDVLAMPYEEAKRIFGESADALRERVNPFDELSRAYLHGANRPLKEY